MPPLRLLLLLLISTATTTKTDALNPQSQRFDAAKHPLVAAAWKHDPALVKKLLDAAGPVGSEQRRKLAERPAPDQGSPPPGEPWTPLWAALLSIEASSFSAAPSPDAREIVRLILEAGVDPRAGPPAPKGWSDEGDTALIFAARLTQNPEIVAMLIGAGGPAAAAAEAATTPLQQQQNKQRAAWVNRRNAKNATALHAASRCEWRVSGGDAAALRVVEMLLSAGADPSLKNRQGCPPLEVVSSPCTAGAVPRPRYKEASGACAAFGEVLSNKKKQEGNATTTTTEEAGLAARVADAWRRAPSDGSFCPRTFAALREAGPGVRGREAREASDLAPCDA